MREFLAKRPHYKYKSTIQSLVNEYSVTTNFYHLPGNERKLHLFLTQSTNFLTFWKDTELNWLKLTLEKTIPINDNGEKYIFLSECVHFLDRIYELENPFFSKFYVFRYFIYRHQLESTSFFCWLLLSMGQSEDTW